MVVASTVAISLSGWCDRRCRDCALWAFRRLFPAAIAASVTWRGCAHPAGPGGVFRDAWCGGTAGADGGDAIGGRLFLLPNSGYASLPDWARAGVEIRN